MARWNIIFFSLYLLLFFLGNGNALKCYICNNCNTYEPTQSRQCDISSHFCMKLDVTTGQVQRRCATHELCKNPEDNVKTRHMRVSCCDTDNCNAAQSIQSLSRSLSTFLAVAFGTTLFFIL